jgi:hypothetical protein
MMFSVVLIGTVYMMFYVVLIGTVDHVLNYQVRSPCRFRAKKADVVLKKPTSDRCFFCRHSFAPIIIVYIPYY